MARVSRVGLGWAVEDRTDWYSNILDWYNAEKLIDYGSLIEAVCKGDLTKSGSNTTLSDDAPHGAWFYADPSVYYDLTNEDDIPFISEITSLNALDLRCSGIFLKTNGVSASLVPLITKNKRSIVEDCRIQEVNPSGTSYAVRIDGAGSQANQDVLIRCVVDRVNTSNTSELVKQAVANGYGAVRNCVLDAGAGKYIDGSNNVGLEVTDTVGLGSAGYDATSLILNTSSSEDASGTAGLTLIDSSALSNYAGKDYRTKSGGALDVQGTNTPYIGAGLDAVIGDGITLTPFSTTGRYVFNREISGSDRQVDVSITLTGDPSGGIQWRLINNATDQPISGYDWSEFLASPAAGQYTVPVGVPTSTGKVWYKLQLRFTANTSVNTESVREFAVGAIVVDNGQSNSIYRDERTSNPPTIDADASYCNSSGWQDTFSLGNGAIEKANQLIALLDVPVGYYNNGSISKDLDYFVTGAGWVALSGVLTNYFDNYFELMCFDQGEADALIPTSTTDYQTKSQLLYDNLLFQMSRAQSDFVFQVNLGGNSNAYNPGTYTDETLEAIRLAKRNFVNANTGAIWGGHRIDLPLSDTIHTQTPFYEVAAQREIQAYGFHLGINSQDASSRSISSAQLSGTQLTVNYTAGPALSKVGSGASTITLVSDDSFATQVAITDTVVSTDAVVHTLAQTPSGEVDIREYYGIDTDVSTRPDLVFQSFATSSSVAPPVVTVDPQPVTVTEPTGFVLSSAATGADSSQWYKDGTPISGETGNNLTVVSSSTSDTGNYVNRFSNAGGFSDTASAAVLVNEGVVSSTLQLTIDGANNDLYTAMKFYDDSANLFIIEANVQFANNAASIVLPVASGTVVTGNYKGANPPVTGTGIYGVTV